LSSVRSRRLAVIFAVIAAFVIVALPVMMALAA
jgi:hypothetical protein